MAWSDPFSFPFGDEDDDWMEHSRNRICFIRKDHKCGKIFNASKSCFIACPSEGFDMLLDLIEEKLTKRGIDAYVAVRNRALGQDIFCAKICGKIIESRFCIIILDDYVKNGTGIPNPNVYYEYGLMTSLKKHVIPLQKENLKLAFNIQSHDIIRYNDKNIAAELEKAIENAINITEKHKGKNASLPERKIFWKFEKAGLRIEDDREKDRFGIIELTDGTDFKPLISLDKGILVFLGKIDEEKELEDYLEEIELVVYRTDVLDENLKKRKGELEASIKELTRAEREGGRIMLSRSSLERQKDQLQKVEENRHILSKVYFGFIIDQKIDVNTFLEQINKFLVDKKRYQLSKIKGNEMLLGDISVPCMQTE